MNPHSLGGSVSQNTMPPRVIGRVAILALLCGSGILRGNCKSMYRCYKGIRLAL